MSTNRKSRGAIVNHDSPNWSPLQKLVGLELTGLFMWMFEVELRNRTRIHAYQHRYTRAYLYVGIDGRCFGYEDEGAYRQISQYLAVVGVFGCWDGNDSPGLVHLTRRERAALEFTREYASTELLEPGQASPLEDGDLELCLAAPEVPYPSEDDPGEVYPPWVFPSGPEARPPDGLDDIPF